MKRMIAATVSAFVRSYEERPGIATRWGDPLVGFCDAKSSAVRELRCSVAPDHLMPEDILAGANVVVVYFLPFTRELAETNCAGTGASPAWAYAETNALFAELNDQLADLIRSRGGTAAVPGAAAGFAGESLMSRWSHRHFAVLAGLGTFGVNNMLITRAGCCGRVSSFAAQVPEQKGVCGRCFARCPSGGAVAGGV